MSVILSDADFSDMHHALGYPPRAHSATHRNYYCTAKDSTEARRFEETGCWDFGRFINDGRDAIFHVNGVGKQKLAEWLTRQNKKTG